MNLVLIGYRGTGKTEVARILAARLGWPWFDSDERVELLASKSIARIFADDGEPAFRDWECLAIAKLAAQDNVVIALGGGAVMRPETQNAIARRSRVVWLTASAATIWKRVQADPQTAARRPNLTACGGITEIITTLDARRGIYRRCAQLEVDTDDKTPDEVADTILEQIHLLSQ